MHPIFLVARFLLSVASILEIHPFVDSRKTAFRETAAVTSQVRCWPSRAHTAPSSRFKRNLSLAMRSSVNDFASMALSNGLIEPPPSGGEQ